MKHHIYVLGALTSESGQCVDSSNHQIHLCFLKNERKELNQSRFTILLERQSVESWMVGRNVADVDVPGWVLGGWCIGNVYGDNSLESFDDGNFGTGICG